MIQFSKFLILIKNKSMISLCLDFGSYHRVMDPLLLLFFFISFVMSGLIKRCLSWWWYIRFIMKQHGILNCIWDLVRDYDRWTEVRWIISSYIYYYIEESEFHCYTNSMDIACCYRGFLFKSHAMEKQTHIIKEKRLCGCNMWNDGEDQEDSVTSYTKLLSISMNYKKRNGGLGDCIHQELHDRGKIHHMNNICVASWFCSGRPWITFIITGYTEDIW